MPDKLIPGEKKTPVYKRSGFKLKSGNNMKGSSFKMMGSSSPAKLREVYINGELVAEGGGKGPEAVAAGKKAEEERAAAKATPTPTTGVVDSGMSPSEKKNARIRELEAENLATEETANQKVTYTGQDAHDRIDASDMSHSEKVEEHNKVDKGGTLHGFGERGAGVY